MYYPAEPPTLTHTRADKMHPAFDSLLRFEFTDSLVLSLFLNNAQVKGKSEKNCLEKNYKCKKGSYAKCRQVFSSNEYRFFFLFDVAELRFEWNTEIKLSI